VPVAAIALALTMPNRALDQRAALDGVKVEYKDTAIDRATAITVVFNH
jgi:hypothetical protein